MSIRFCALAARMFVYVVFSGFIPQASGAIIVNPARPISHRLQVQIIQTSLDNGLLPANILGTASQRAYIETNVDKIWAQAGIDVEFLPSVTRYPSTFALQGTTLPRPANDLNTIVSRARTAGKLNPIPQVINMFFVNIPPGFDQLSPSHVAGIATVNGNGIAMFTGSSLLTFGNGRDAIAGVVAHEIGHNLGLGHSSSGTANLMASGRTTEQLSLQQIETVLKSNLLQPAILAGDFSGDGMVNGADLTVWRSAYGVNANGDADGDNDTDGRDFLIWQRHYGGAASSSVWVVPEPTGLALVLMCSLAKLSSRAHRHRTPC